MDVKGEKKRNFKDEHMRSGLALASVVTRLSDTTPQGTLPEKCTAVVKQTD